MEGLKSTITNATVIEHISVNDVYQESKVLILNLKFYIATTFSNTHRNLIPPLGLMHGNSNIIETSLKF